MLVVHAMTTSSQTPATIKKTLAIATESLRACGIVIHSTAGTLVSTRKKTSGGSTAAVTEAMRLVRAAEGLIRQATTVLVDAAVNKAAPVEISSGDTSAANTATSPSKSARRRRNRAQKKQTSPAGDVAMDTGSGALGTALGTDLSSVGGSKHTAPNTAPSRVLGAKVSLERSPRRAGATSSAAGHHKLAFEVGQSVILGGLLDKSDLIGQFGKVTGYDLASQRYMVLHSSCELAMEIRAENLCL